MSTLNDWIDGQIGKIGAQGGGMGDERRKRKALSSGYGGVTLRLSKGFSDEPQ